jgi:predicted dehydrogenase
VLIVGCGSIGERHLRCFLSTGRTDVTACEANPDVLARITARYAVKGAVDWKAEIESGVHDAVVVCTPAPLHVPIGLKALREGRHVLIEKPLSHSLAGVDELLTAEKQSRATAAVAYVLHVAPWLAAARAFIRQGEIGSVRQVVFSSGQPFDRLRPGYAQSYYRDRRVGGGAIQDALTHSANWIESVVGPTDSLICDCAHLALRDVEVEDTVHVAARNGDVLVSYALNQFQAPNESFFQFNSPTGSVRIEPYLQRWGVLRANETQWTWHREPVADRDAHFIAQANAFLDQAEGQSSRLCTLSAAAQTLRFNLAALASATRGSRVRCQDLDA